MCNDIWFYDAFTDCCNAYIYSAVQQQQQQQQQQYLHYKFVDHDDDDDDDDWQTWSNSWK